MTRNRSRIEARGVTSDAPSEVASAAAQLQQREEHLRELRQRREAAERVALEAAASAPTPEQNIVAEREQLVAESVHRHAAARALLRQAAREATDARAAESAATDALKAAFEGSPLGALLAARRARFDVARRLDAALQGRVPGLSKLRSTVDPAIEQRLGLTLSDLEQSGVDVGAVRSSLDDKHPAYAPSITGAQSSHTFSALVQWLTELLSPEPLAPGAHIISQPVLPPTGRGRGGLV